MAKTVEELEKELLEANDKANALAASKQRIEEESKSYKERAKKAELLIDEAEKQKLESEGKINEVLQKERETNKKLLGQLNETRNSVLREKLRSEVANEAKDALDIDLLLRVNEHSEILKLDSENLTVEGVGEFVAKVRESKPFLFGKKKIKDGEPLPPNGEGDQKTSDEKYFAELKDVTSRKELDNLRKKYGK